ncbi:MAG: haloalkane dehalogenase [Pseudomonadales bacterium]|nr:haloalkane dehalogenase [Pseudomonadales bacterium]
MKKSLLILRSLLAVLALGLTSGLAAQEPTIIRGEKISPDFPYESHYVEVLGSRMHYVDEGEGDPILFIHGNPTSSYLWRNVIPHVSGHYRAIAVDLIGMGKSDKPELDYTYLDHRRYLNAFIQALDLKNITFVIHDWGSVLGFDYAMHNEANTLGVAFMEALIPPRFPIPAEPPADSIFGRFRTAGEGEKLIYEDHYFMEQMVPGGVVRKLSEEEMNHYREPYLAEGSRKPILQWPRELPMGGKPAANVEVISSIGAWMKTTKMPMLHLWAGSGGMNPDGNARYYVDNVADIESYFLGEGRHYLQEDHPEMIGVAVNDWRRRLDERK